MVAIIQPQEYSRDTTPLRLTVTGGVLKGLCHEMNNFLGLTNQISCAFWFCGDGL